MQPKNETRSIAAKPRKRELGNLLKSANAYEKNGIIFQRQPNGTLEVKTLVKILEH